MPMCTGNTYVSPLSSALISDLIIYHYWQRLLFCKNKKITILASVPSKFSPPAKMPEIVQTF